MDAAVKGGTRAPSGEADTRSWVLLFVGVATASLSAILIRYATGADALAISFWRCAAGTVVLAPWARPGIRNMRRADMRLPAIAGAFLAFHFATWITSLEQTTVAASVLLVSTTPVFVAVAARWLWGQRLAAAGVVGITLALLGTALVTGGDLEGSSLPGNALALCGGAGAAGYVLAGRLSRKDLGIVEYSVITYGIAALLLWVACLATGTALLGYPAQTWWAIAAIVVGPQLLGHTVINFVLKDINATTVSVAIMAEPIIAIALAWLLLDEVPAALAYAGGITILAGIYLVSTSSRGPEIEAD